MISRGPTAVVLLISRARANQPSDSHKAGGQPREPLSRVCVTVCADLCMGQG